MLLVEINEEGFKAAEAIIKDEIFTLSSEISEETDLAKYKLAKARERNPDFEEVLAEMICGEEVNSFPYRKGYELTDFFQKNGFQYTHDGSTRRYWVRDVLLQLDIHEISTLIRKGLFNKFVFKKLKLPDGIETPEESYRRSISEFKYFIDDSFNMHQEADLGDILDLSINTDILFNKDANTPDKELNQLLAEAKDRFLISSDKQIALEKVWDAFERLKTFYGSDKKDSVNQILDLLSTELERSYLDEEFRTLTKIGNEYRIRHHETNKREIKDSKLINYIFFRMLTLIDFCISKINTADEIY